MNAGHDVVGPGHLYTWIDIENYFKVVAMRGEWPDWLLEVDAYWDSVEFSVREGLEPDGFWQWLQRNLGPLSVDQEREVVVLESEGDHERILPVLVTVAENVTHVERKPKWHERRIVRELVAELPPAASQELPNGVQICAFHSFKGGVGRTLHCVALAHEIADRKHVNGSPIHRVLLIDADLEAPGISWMISTQGGQADFALEDFLALLHGASEAERPAVIQLARRYLINQEHDGILILPARRDLTRVEPSTIEPVDLLTSDRSPYFLSEALAELAKAVEADVVLVDLRAGNSELSAPILLDSRVQRVFVTTISDQSVRGTKNLIEVLGRRAPSRSASEPVCKVILTQFQEKDHESEMANAAGALATAIAASVRISLDEEIKEPEGSRSIVDQDLASQLLTSPFDSQLLALPATWSQVRDVVDVTQLARSLSALADSMFTESERTPMSPVQESELEHSRTRLNSVAKPLVYAESAEGEDDLLSTDALVNLVSTHRTEPPVEIVVGAKGSGKTFTYLRMCAQGNWAAFAALTSVTGVELDAPLVPVLGSQHLSDSLRGRVEQVQDRSASVVGGGEPARFLAIRDLIVESLELDLNDVDWRRIWLTCLAHAAGFTDTVPAQAESVLTTIARAHRAIFVLDGLEDLFQRFSTDSREQQALRVLLTGCPEWLRSLRGRPLGLVVFVRRDLVINAIHQNTQQFLARYQASELRWNRTEALRLAAWVCERARAIETFGASTRSATSKQLSELLAQLWGQKLGSNKSREARSEEWFLAALSDFNQQIQARDIVSFLAEATRIALDDGKISSRWEDRLLPPTAMRRALPECSRDKITSLTQENAPVGKLLTRLSDLSVDARKVPFTLESVGLSPAEARLLETNGVLFREENQYWIPEIYRHGLDFGVTGTGRPRVLAVAKLVRRRNDV